MANAQHNARLRGGPEADIAFVRREYSWPDFGQRLVGVVPEACELHEQDDRGTGADLKSKRAITVVIQVPGTRLTRETILSIAYMGSSDGDTRSLACGCWRGKEAGLRHWVCGKAAAIAREEDTPYSRSGP